MSVIINRKGEWRFDASIAILYEVPVLSDTFTKSVVYKNIAFEKCPVMVLLSSN